MLKVNNALKIILIFLLFIPVVSATKKLQLSQLQTGDIILMSLQCRLCQLIELEEGLPYSHMAVVIRNKDKILFAESWNEGVGLKNEFEFWQDKKLTPSSEMLILRHVSQSKINLRKEISATSALENYLNSYLGKKYDPYFLWDNFDEDDQPIYYCSEFIYKLFKNWLGDDLILQTKAMSYVRYYSQWEKYFKSYGQSVPAGKIGISPADFAKSEDFEVMNLDFSESGY